MKFIFVLYIPYTHSLKAICPVYTVPLFDCHMGSDVGFSAPCIISTLIMVQILEQFRSTETHSPDFGIRVALPVFLLENVVFS
jgi:hypothetical protein